MRRSFAGGLVLFAMASASALACTFIVDGQFKEFSGTCQISGIGDNVCGRCIAQKCQSKIDGLCNNSSAISYVATCAQDPAPGSNWNCKNVMGPSVLDSSALTPAENDLNHCAAGCMDPCTTCTSIDAGSGACGSCIMSSCASLLNGNDGCCDNETVGDGIAKCVATVNASCSSFRARVASVLDAGGDGGPNFRSCKDYSADEFAKCVVDHCDPVCPQ